MEFKQGATRNVLLAGGVALKFPRLCEWRLFLHGLLANMQEARFSGADGFSDLCPVLWSIPGGFLVCMRRAEPLEADFPTNSAAKSWLEARRLDGICEGKTDCFGVLEGRIIVVDYGAWA